MQNGLIYDVEDLNQIPESPGVYVFSRVHGETVSPLYIGKAEILGRRIEQQLNNVRLMRGIENAEGGYRILHVAEFIGKRGQDSGKAIRIIESTLISAALVEGYELINIIRNENTCSHNYVNWESGGTSVATGEHHKATACLTPVPRNVGANAPSPVNRNVTPGPC